MNNQTQIISKINETKNILITVGHDPSVDVLTAALGLTLAIDKMKKHSSAIFSGEIPPIMEFLRPEQTFESSTESFRDFIISLDKEKADKLRYKIEGNLVKIFITPYHTTLSPADLKFEQGDLNVDLIIALDVKEQGDIDKAAMAHGKILHSATVITINTETASNFGSINSKIAAPSGYSEAIAKLIINMNEELLSKQISTALLTGIVIETEQFSNVQTTPDTMAIASKLLGNGADQQLIVKEIRGMVAEAKAPVKEPKPERISFEEELAEVEPEPEPIPEPDSEPVPEPAPKPEEPGKTLEDYLPPPLPESGEAEFPEPPDVNAPEFSEAISPVQPNEVAAEETSHLKDIPDGALPPPPDIIYDQAPVQSDEPTTETPEQPKSADDDDTPNLDSTQFHIPV